MTRAVLLTLAIVLLAGCGERRTDAPEDTIDDVLAAVDTTQFDVGEPLVREPAPVRRETPEAVQDAAPSAPPQSGPRETNTRPTLRPSPRPTPDAPPDAPRTRRPLAVAAPVPAPEDGRFALLVGISDYPGTRDDLPSGQHDVEAMRRVLVERYGYRPTNVRVLIDGDATRGAIRTAIGAHLGQARTTALLYVSGHGVRLASNPGLADAEPDGRDEALYVWADPASGGASGARGALILDDEIGAWTDQLGAKRVLVVLDACHSGTGARGRREGAPPVKEVMIDSLSLDPAAPWMTPSEAPSAAPVASGERTILLAAARAREQAYAGLEGEPSLFTRILTEVLAEAPADWPLADAMASVRGHVESVSRGYGQMHSPRLEGGGALALADLLAPEADPPAD